MGKPIGLESDVGVSLLLASSLFLLASSFFLPKPQLSLREELKR
jgi:hypothetical protein